MLDAAYLDVSKERSIVAIRPNPALQALFELATTREGVASLSTKSRVRTQTARRRPIRVCGELV